MATVTIRLDDEVRDRVAAVADGLGMTVSTYVRGALENALKLEGTEEIESSRPTADERVELTKIERKILVMLHRNLLAAKGNLDDSFYDEESEVKALKVLEGGFVGDYAEEFADLREPMTQAECELVWDILDMFRVIGPGSGKLDDGGSTPKKARDSSNLAAFRGFDLNDVQEARLLMYARHLVSNDRWAEQAEVFSRENDRGNSHARMLPTYRAMLRVFKPLWRQTIQSGARWHLTKDEIELIVQAARSPR